MRILPALVGLSLLLNAYVIWRQNEQAEPVVVSPISSSNAPERQTNSAPNDSSNHDADAVDVEGMARILTTIEILTKRIESLEESPVLDEGHPVADLEKSIKEERISSTLTGRLNSSPSDEEWFWNASSDQEVSLSFANTDGFDVRSTDCRSGWCRVEIEEYITDAEGLESTRELQLKISESLGRDTSIRWGKKQGNLRVIYVQ